MITYHIHTKCWGYESQNPLLGSLPPIRMDTLKTKGPSWEVIHFWLSIKHTHKHVVCHKGAISPTSSHESPVITRRTPASTHESSLMSWRTPGSVHESPCPVDVNTSNHSCWSPPFLVQDSTVKKTVDPEMRRNRSWEWLLTKKQKPKYKNLQTKTEKQKPKQNPQSFTVAT